jgi:tRNA modification GTPase
MNAADTIAAISSAVGAGARMIVRASGGDAHRIAGALTDQLEISAGAARRCRLGLGVSAWVYIFSRPRSYTGEDLVELHLPGSPLVARMVLDAMIRLGARHAEPGEFTARAYFNGRIDLTQAEGVAATIGAHSERELRAARSLLAGELARRVQPILDAVAQTLALLEAGIDFSDEDISFISAEDVRKQAGGAVERLDALLGQSARFERLTHEPRIVLVGAPNAGKSTLLNALARRDRAVVSPVAGTTRDALAEHVRLERGVVQVVDVAGLEEGAGARAHGSGNALADVERQMREQALREVATADLVVLVHDPTCSANPTRLDRTPDFVVHTKSDLLAGSFPPPVDSSRFLSISAKTGANLDILRGSLDALAFGSQAPGPALALNARHVTALSDAREALTRAVAMLGMGPELVALELRESLDALGGILGKLSPDDLLGRIFSAFCIGK